MDETSLKKLYIIMMGVFSLLILFFFFWAYTYPNDLLFGIFFAIIGFFGIRKYYRKYKELE
jgi:hypothetical protein